MKKIKKLNKKGFLLGEETVKLIIAVVCLVVLVIFLYSLYMANRNKEYELAKASLQKLVSDINAGQTESVIYNPKDWFIGSYPEKVVGGEVMPKLCSGENWGKCLCICKPYKSASYDDCDLSYAGICQENDFIVEGPTAIGAENNVILMSSLPLNLKLENKQITLPK